MQMSVRTTRKAKLKTNLGSKLMRGEATLRRKKALMVAEKNASGQTPKRAS